MSSTGLSSVAHAFCLEMTRENGIPLKSSDPDPNDESLQLISRSGKRSGYRATDEMLSAMGLQE